MTWLFRLNVVLCIIFPSIVLSQDKISIESVSGVATGWWIYNRGTTDPSLFNNQGWDRTQHSVFLPFELNAFYKLNRVKIGVGIGRSLFLEDTMRAFEDSDNTFSRYDISTGSVKFTEFSLQTEVDVVVSENYYLGPKIEFGFFEIKTTHPQKENFGRQTYWQIGLTNEIRFSKIGLIVRPSYQALIILPKRARAQKEKHAIYNFGIHFGLRYWVK